ncbi:MAG: hypothetical protein PUE13_03435, partial [Clostridiales bacterium]|nr:hypothetical protein [Clostridiales bacterium]
MYGSFRIYDQSSRLTAEAELVWATIDAEQKIVMYPTHQYIWGPDRVLAHIDFLAGQSYYYLYNGHGDVVQVVDTAGNVKNSYDYDV